MDSSHFQQDVADAISAYDVSEVHAAALLSLVQSYLAEHCQPRPKTRSPSSTDEQKAFVDNAECRPSTADPFQTTKGEEAPTPVRFGRRSLEPNKDPNAYLYRLQDDPMNAVPLGQMWGDATLPTTSTLKQASQPGISPEVRRSSGSRPAGGTGGGSVFSRLTDHTKYTGTHVHRFTSDGQGRGLDGRDTGALGGGSHMNMASDNGTLKLRSGMGAGTGITVGGKTTYVARNQNHVLR